MLDYWQDPERENKLFFCQVEALESMIHITEVSGRYGDAWIENRLREFNADANPELFRVAFKMATGTGKTQVAGQPDAGRELVVSDLNPTGNICAPPT